MEALLTALCLSAALPMDEKLQSKDTDGGRVTSQLADIPIADPKIVKQHGKPPEIVYPPSRRSKGFVTAGNIRYPVDGGVEWQGKIAYYSLTCNLVVTDAKTGKAHWHKDDSAFWNTLTFENLAKEKEPERWAVVLKSSGHPQFSQCYDLNTGNRYEMRGTPPPPPGTKLTPRKQWFGVTGVTGVTGVSHKSMRTLVGSAEEWTKLRKELFGEQQKHIPESSEIDFSKEMLLVLYGKGLSPSGPSPELVVENDDAFVVRVQVPTYKLVVLPRRVNKPVVLEYDERVYIGSPSFWKERERLILKGDSKDPIKKDR